MKIIGCVLISFLLAGCYGGRDNIYQGYVEGEYTYLAPVYTGRLQRLYVARGQRVTQGQRLFDLETQPELDQYKRSQAELASQQAKLKDYLSGQRSTVLGGIIAQREQAQADLELATNNFNRNKILYQKGVIPRSTYDDSLAQLKANQQRVAQFEQNLREAEQGERQFRIVEQSNEVKANEASTNQAKWQLTQKSMVAPDEGLIFNTYYTQGELIPANQAVLALLSPKNVYVVFFIPEPLRATLQLGDVMIFTCDGCRTNYKAVINYISPQAEYTPPVIYSRESRSKLVYRVQAALTPEVANVVHPGQPVEIRPERREARFSDQMGFNFIQKMYLHTNQWIWKWNQKK